MKKGFTLIEVLSIIVILGIITVLVLPKISTSSTDKKQKEYDKLVELIENAGKSYLSSHPTEVAVEVNTLLSNEYLTNDITDPFTNTNINGCISRKVIEGINKYEFGSTCVGNVSLTVDLDNGSIDINPAGEHSTGSTITLSSPAKPDFIFAGWNIVSGNSTISGNTLTIGTGTTTIKAEWVIITKYSYTANVQTFIVPKTGTYKIELWGAQGGTGNASAGGKGGYTSGEINLQLGEILYVYIGSKGNSGVVGTSATCPFNGGGNGGTRNYSSEGESGAGGGATDIRCFSSNNLCISNTTNLEWNDVIGLNSRIMVAGAGGGGANYINPANGGYSGGLVGSSGILNEGNNPHTLGVGGNQTLGGTSASSGGTSGSFGKGGNGEGTLYGAGGGSGYYGGGTGGHTSGGISSGAGGSSYVSGYTGCVAVTSEGISKPGCSNETTDNSCSIHYSGKIFIDDENRVMKAGNEEMPTHDGISTMIGNSGNGYAKITYIESE